MVILADSTQNSDSVQMDSRTLASLLLIRDMQTQRSQAKDRGEGLEGSGVSGAGGGGGGAGGTKDGAFRSWLGELQEHSNGCEVVAEVLDLRTRNLLNETNIGAQRRPTCRSAPTHQLVRSLSSVSSIS